MKPSVRRVLRLLARHRMAYAAGIACLLATNALNLAIPWLLKVAFDGLQAGRPAGFVGAVAAGMAGVALLRGVVRTASRMAILGTSRRVITDLRETVFAHVQRLPMSFFDRMPTGDIVSRLISDLTYVRSLFGPVAMNLANTVALYVMAVALLVRLDPLLTAVALLPYLMVAGLVKRTSRRLHAESTEAQAALARISSRLTENLNGITVIKSHRREEQEIAEFDRLTDDYYEANRKFSRTRAVLVPLMSAVGSLGVLAVLGLGGLRVMQGDFTIGDFVAFNATLAMMSWPSAALGFILNALQRGLSAMDRLEEILEEPPEVAAGTRTAAGVSIAGPVELRHCTYVHSGADRPALHDVSFRIERGGRLGVVGRTGSGKSTLLDLLTGLRIPPRGMVFLDEVDVNDVPLSELRARLGAVPQGAFAFSTTVGENIAYGLPEPPDEARVLAATREAAFEKDLEQLPAGLDTVIGERGVTLSGGQRQRLTLARALARDPALLLLDDSLSAVDTETEREILEQLARRSGDRTTTEIIVSHRLSAVVHCDEILVLEEGRVVERGTHDELLALDGRYAETWREQELSRELSEVD